MKQTVLGHELIGTSFAVGGALDEAYAEFLLHQVVYIIGMTPFDDVVIKRFNGSEGGGVGYTAVQFLVESFAIIDCWDEHEGFYLIIHSCRPYSEEKVRGLLESFGFIILESFKGTVKLKKNLDKITKPSWLRRLISWRW